MDSLHPILLRQLRRLGISVDDPPSDARGWQSLLQRVSTAYSENEADTYLLQRSLGKVSEEMEQLNAELRVRAKSEVVAERDRLDAVLRALTDAFCSIDLSGETVTMNPAAELLLETNSVSIPLLPRLLIEQYPDLSVPENRRSLLAHLASGGTVRDDHALLLPPETTTAIDADADPAGLPTPPENPNPVPISVLLFPIEQNGTVTGAGVVIRDTSDVVSSDRRLRRLEKAVDASADGIVVSTARGTIEYVNSMFTEMTGWRAEEVLDQPFSMLENPAEDPAVYADMRATLLSGHAWRGRITHSRRHASESEFGDQPRATSNNQNPGQPAGRTFWTDTTITPYFDSSGTVLGFVGLWRDATAVVAAERQRHAKAVASNLRIDASSALHSSAAFEERIQAILQILVRGLADDGGRSWTVSLTLDQAEDDTGTRVFSEGVDSDNWRATVEAGLGHSVESVSQVTRFGPDQMARPNDGPMGVVVPLGQDSAVRGHLALFAREPFPREESILQALVAIADMVTLSMAESRAQRSAELAREAAEEAVRTKSAFLANMSHEIRTPMNGVLGMLDMLTFTDLNANQQEFVSVAQSSAEILLTVINDILDISKIEAGRIDLERISFDLRQVAEEVTALYSAQATAKDLELSCFVSPRLPNAVIGDPTRVRQVLSNLIGNAIKFTEIGGVTVRVLQDGHDARGTAIDSATSGTGADISIEVTDTGIGMTQETLEGLFSPFTQGDASTTRRFGGTGLGLAISGDLVNLMGGSIEVESSEGVGTTFRVKLELSVPEGTPEPANRICAKNARILVVDDSRTNREVLTHYLADWGLQIAEATNGTDALSQVTAAIEAGHPFDLLMIDMQMPGLDGLSLARQLRSAPVDSAAKLVLVSSMGIDQGLVSTGVFDATISKPVRYAALLDVLCDLLEPNPRSLQPAPPAANPEAPLSGRVLLVEDTYVNRRVAEGMLARFGLDVTVAENGKSALDVLCSQAFDLVLMDCQMPVMDGFEATREFRKLEPAGQRLPILALTADAMAGTAERCRDAGMDAHITKPYTLKALRAAIQPWLKQ